MLLFSIILPTFNSESTILECLDSILIQSYTSFEILVMDALSSDNTIPLISSYKDDRIKIISQKDTGVYDAMNKGIHESSGDFLYFMGSDDTLYDKDVFSRMLDVIQKEHADIVYGNAFFLKKNTIYDGEFDRKKIIEVGNICHQAIFYSKHIFSRIGYYNLDFFMYADWDFNIRCFSTPDLKIKYVDTIIAYYNDYSGISNSARIDSAFFEQTGIGLVLESQSLKNSRDYRLGNILLSPLRFLKKYIWFQS